MRWTVSEVSSKIIRRLCVREQAYKPARLPLSLWVFSDGEKGSFFGVSRIFESWGSREGFLCNSFDADLMNCFFGRILNKLFLEISYRLHNIIHRFKFHAWLILGLQHSFFKRFSPLLFFKKIPDEVLDLLDHFFRKFKEHAVYGGFFHRLHLHGLILKNNSYSVNGFEKKTAIQTVEGG